jgi:hypothetical protein
LAPAAAAGSPASAAQPAAAALQDGLDRRHAGADDLAHLFGGVLQHVEEDDHAALGRRHAHEGRQARGRRFAPRLFIDGVNEQVHVVLRVGAVRAHAPPQRVEGEVVGDAEQPALGVVDGLVGRGRLQRAQQGLLHDVLAIQRRAEHPRAIAVQARAQALEIDGRQGAGFGGWRLGHGAGAQ